MNKVQSLFQKGNQLRRRAAKFGDSLKHMTRGDHLSKEEFFPTSRAAVPRQTGQALSKSMRKGAGR